MDFTPPVGENYRSVRLRVAEWYTALARDPVVAAHAGTARVLFALLKILPCAQAVESDVMHGAVYVFFADGKLRVYQASRPPS